jgi:hypothetical protein
VIGARYERLSGKRKKMLVGWEDDDFDSDDDY